MPRKGETTKFKGTKSEPSKAAKTERERKKKRDREDEKDAEQIGARARLNRSRPECPICFEEVATHKLIPCNHNYCLYHAQHCLQTRCALCRQTPAFFQPPLNLAEFSKAVEVAPCLSTAVALLNLYELKSGKSEYST